MYEHGWVERAGLSERVRCGPTEDRAEGRQRLLIHTLCVLRRECELVQRVIAARADGKGVEMQSVDVYARRSGVPVAPHAAGSMGMS